MSESSLVKSCGTEQALVGPGEPSIVLHIDLPDYRQFYSVKKHIILRRSHGSF